VRKSHLNGPRAIAAALALLLTLAPGAARPARAASEVITNGAFTNGFTGWTRMDQIGSEGTFALQTGTVSPVNGITVPAPPSGPNAAMTDAFGGGAHVLYQDFVVPTGDNTGSLRFSLFIGNRATAFFTPNTLDWATPTLNQQARVDILRSGADPFSLAPADVLQNAFRTLTTNPLVSGYTNFTVDVSQALRAQAGQPFRLRFAETDNVNLFQFGVDNVSLVTTTPEPAGVVVLGTGLLGTGLLGWLARRRKRRTLAA